MERSPTTVLRIGDWRVDPVASQISRDGETARVEERTMRVLLCLAEQAGEVVSIDELLNQVWAGVNVAPDSVYQAVASLRRALGDNPKEPKYIATVPRLGYRMVAAVSPWEERLGQTHTLRGVDGEGSAAAADRSSPTARFPAAFGRVASGGLFLAAVVTLLAVLMFRSKAGGDTHSAAAAGAPLPQKSIGVLPFIDLTEGMHNEEFADGMTEELIDKLSKIPELRVPSATSSFYFKGKLWPLPQGTPQITIADVAQMLGVAYVLDGSVRKSGTRMRIAARLIRAENGYVVWSETYDRPFDDILGVQDEIGGEVAKALKASIEDRSEAR